MWTIFISYIAKLYILYKCNFTLYKVAIGVDSYIVHFSPTLLAAGHKVYGYCGQLKTILSALSTS